MNEQSKAVLVAGVSNSHSGLQTSSQSFFEDNKGKFTIFPNGYFLRSLRRLLKLSPQQHLCTKIEIQFMIKNTSFSRIELCP